MRAHIMSIYFSLITHVLLTASPRKSDIRTDRPNDRDRDSRRYIRPAGGKPGVVKNSVLPRWRSAANSKIAEAFNHYFIKIGPKLASGVTRLSPNNVNTYLKLPDSDSPSFRFTYIPVENVLTTLAKIFKSI